MDDAMRVASKPHDFKLMVLAASKATGDDGPEAEVDTAPPAPVGESAAPPPPVPSAPMTVGLTDPQPPPPAAPQTSAPPPGVTY